MAHQGGRKPKPRHLKVIAGTLRKDRDNPAAPSAAGGPLVAPTWMRAPPASVKKAERATRALMLGHFERIAGALEEIGCASPSFLDAVVLTARVLTDIDELSASLAEEGMTFEKPDVNGEPMLRAHPAAAMRATAITQAKALLSELGLTPTSLAKASKTGGKAKGNGFKELFG